MAISLTSGGASYIDTAPVGLYKAHRTVIFAIVRALPRALPLGPRKPKK